MQSVEVHEMTTLTPLFTITLSVFGSVIFVFVLYGIHAYLIPYRRSPRHQTEPTLPLAEKPIHPNLRGSLYSFPTINYIDPRNSIINYELRSSNWSTSVLDLPSSTSKNSSTHPEEHAISPRTVSIGSNFRTSLAFEQWLSQTMHLSNGPRSCYSGSPNHSCWQIGSSNYLDSPTVKSSMTSPSRGNIKHCGNLSKNTKSRRLSDSALTALSASALWLQPHLIRRSDEETASMLSFANLHCSESYQQPIGDTKVQKVQYRETALASDMAASTRSLRNALDNDLHLLLSPSSVTNSSRRRRSTMCTCTASSSTSILQLHSSIRTGSDRPSLPRTCRLASVIQDEVLSDTAPRAKSEGKEIANSKALE